MTATLTPEAQQLADELVKRLGAQPMTARELAAELGSTEAPIELLRALERTLSSVAARGEDEELDEGVWGPEPSDEQLSAATASGSALVIGHLRTALAHALTRDAAAERLGISPQAVSKRLAAGKLVSLRRGRVRLLPAWQFHADGTLPALDEVIAAYPGDALSLTTWATTSSPDLDGLTPAQTLTRRGGDSAVLEVLAALTPAAW